jgi:hypothetical protein
MNVFQHLIKGTEAYLKKLEIIRRSQKWMPQNCENKHPIRLTETRWNLVRRVEMTGRYPHWRALLGNTSREPRPVLRVSPDAFINETVDTHGQRGKTKWKTGLGVMTFASDSSIDFIYLLVFTVHLTTVGSLDYAVFKWMSKDRR